MKYKSKLNTLKQYIKEHWKVLTAVAVLICVGGTAYALTLSGEPVERVDRNSSNREEAPLEPTTMPAPLTGLEVEPERAAEPTTGAMIENSPNARPQTGLDSADMVIETVSEGGITRYLALFQYDIPETIGPIRSVRPYFVDWIMGFDSPVAHVGGSAEALAMLKNRGAKDLDQFQHSGPYYREGSRLAPHNMYVRLPQLRELQHELGYSESDFKAFEWQDGEPANDRQATDITIDYSSQQYQVRFRYDAESNTYKRYLAGQPHVDAGNDRHISVDNLIVVRMPTGQSGQYATMETIGKGEAVIFNNGEAHQARWQQSSPKERLEFTDKNGDQIPLNRGDSWIAVLATDRNLTY